MTPRRPSSLRRPPPGPRRWIAWGLAALCALPVYWGLTTFVIPLPPGARLGTAAVELDGRVYVIGGSGRRGVQGVVESLDPSSGEWRTEPSLLEPRSFHGAGVLDGRIHVVGGLSDSASSGIASVEVLDPVRGSWVSGPPLPQPLNRLGVAADDSVLYAVNGLSADLVDLGVVYVLRPGAEAWDSIPPTPSRGHGASAAVLGGRLFAAGGYSRGRVLERVESYDPVDSVWTEHRSPGVPRGFAGLQAVGDHLYLFGGRVGGLRVVTEALDPDVGAWTPRSPMIQWRDRFGSAVVNGRVYVVGGEAYPGACCGRRVLVYDPEVDEWSKR